MRPSHLLEAVNPGQMTMSDERYLKKSRQYQDVHGHGRSWASNAVVLKAKPNGLEFSRYGFSVSKRVGKAVVRNRVKRRLREIMRMKKLSPGFDMVIVARAAAAESSFVLLEGTVHNLLARAGVLDESFGSCDQAVDQRQSA
jgi:ribonuclease P protein component